MALETDKNSLIVRRNIETWNGDASGEIVHSLGKNQVLRGNSGRDTFVVFEESDTYELIRQNDDSTLLTPTNSSDKFWLGQHTLYSFETVQFLNEAIDISYVGVDIDFDSKKLFEGGSAIGGTINLLKMPTSKVEIEFDENALYNLSSYKFEFDESTWSDQIEFTITSPENDTLQTDKTVELIGLISSADRDYSEVMLPTFEFQYIDNDVPTVGSISGYVWLDENKDGSLSSGEEYTSLGSVYLDFNENGQIDPEEPFDRLSSDGSFEFSNLQSGSYLVGIDLPNGYLTTHPDSGSFSNVAVSSGSIDVSIEIDGNNERYHGAYAELVSANNIASDYGYTGAGQTVVVIDSGIDLNHKFFGPDSNNDNIADKIIFAQDFTLEKDATANDVNGHGTHVAGIIASSDEVYPGIAPDASLIALQCLDAEGNGSSTSLEAALTFCIENAEEYNISVINMSLSFGDNNSSPVDWFLSDELLALNQMGIAVVSASGNDYGIYQESGVAYPSSDPSSFSVGAVYHSDVGAFEAYSTAADQIAPFSQRDETLTTVMAPGVLIPSALPNDEVGAFSGTSMAAPIVAGAIAVLQEAALDILGRKLSVFEIENFLKENSDVIFDGDDENDGLRHTEQNYLRLDMEALITSLKESVEPGFHLVDVEAGEAKEVNFGIAEINSVDSSGEKSGFLIGSSRNDFLEGTINSETIIAGNGDDVLIGGGGADSLSAGGGNDYILISDKGTNVKTGDGNDIIFIDASAVSISVSDFDGGSISNNQTSLQTGSSDNNGLLLGETDVSDLLLRGAGNDEIFGFSGADILVAGLGDDYLYGGDGSDVLIAGAGNDKLYGGEGDDLFLIDLTDQLPLTDRFVEISDFAVGFDNIGVLSDVFFEAPSLVFYESFYSLSFMDIELAKITVSDQLADEEISVLLLPDTYFDQVEETYAVEII